VLLHGGDAPEVGDVESGDAVDTVTGMAVVEPLGRTADGILVEEVHLRSGLLDVRLLTLGASIRSLEMPDREGTRGNVHLCLPTLSDYEDRSLNPYLGASIGRYANRIAGASFDLDGRKVQLAANDGPNSLHGGPDGWDRRVWDLMEATGDTDGGVAVFRLLSSDGDGGFPAAVEATATFEVEHDLLRITYQATSSATTVVNMTNHGYWNLDGAGTVGGHHLQVRAERVLPVDGAGIPLGEPVAVVGTPFDLRSRSRLGPVVEALEPGLDHCFEVDGTPGTLREAATLDSPASGRWMEVRTDQVGVQVYTGNGLGPPFDRHGSVSLETQMFPDTPNRPELGSARLDPAQVYRSLTELRFGVGGR
jgi:aldose 1-epimerase